MFFCWDLDNDNYMQLLKLFQLLIKCHSCTGSINSWLQGNCNDIGYANYVEYSFFYDSYIVIVLLVLLQFN